MGEFGIGKSYLLKELSGEYDSVVLDSNPSKESLEALLKKRCSSKKEAYKALMRRKKTVLFFDDLHESRKDTISTIVRLARKHVIVAASEKMVERLCYDFNTFELKRWDYEKCLKLCRKLKVKGGAAESISRQSKGLPLLVIRGAEYHKVTGEVKCYFQSDWKKDVLRKLVVVAYLCLSLRYLLRNLHSWEAYSWMSMTAYLILALTRYNKKL